MPRRAPPPRPPIALRCVRQAPSQAAEKEAAGGATPGKPAATGSPAKPIEKNDMIKHTMRLVKGASAEGEAAEVEREHERRKKKKKAAEAAARLEAEGPPSEDSEDEAWLEGLTPEERAIARGRLKKQRADEARANPNPNPNPNWMAGG
jgi:hypothetical protein